MALNFAQKTYDVFIFEDDRWLIDSHHDMRSKAIERAEELISDKRFAGVRVLSESKRTGEEEILFEEKIEIGEKALTIVPVDEAPLCQDIVDYYAFPARQTAGRVLRNLLDRDGRTALELAFDFGALRMLERNDGLFPPAMQRVGAVQAKTTGEKPQVRIDALYQAFEQIKENARVAGEDQQRENILANGGLAALLEKSPTRDPKVQRIYVLGGLAQALRKRGDWSDKLRFVMELTEKGPPNLVDEYLDEISAEVFESSEAITDIFGGFGDAVSAYQAMVHLAQGRCRVVNSRSCIEEFNNLLAVHPFPVTKSVLLGRVSRALSGYRQLTREGKEADKVAFKALLRELVSRGGISGGPSMTAAVVSRGRMLLGGDEDLSVAESIDQLMALLPNRAVRLGFLLDLIVSPVGQANENVVLGVLGRLVQQMTSLSSLIPRDMPPEVASVLLDELREKMQSKALPEKWRQLFSSTLDRLVKRGIDPEEPKKPEMVYRLEEPKVSTPGKIERREAKKGDVLFEEGEKASEAYLIATGYVEIFRKVGNGEQVLAKLGPGDIVGEMSLIDDQPRMASARVLDNTTLTVITREDLAGRLDKLASSDKVLRRLIGVFVDRLRGQARMHE